MDNPQTWVQIGLGLFFAILVFMGVPMKVWKSLGDTSDAVRAELDEAVRIREEAQALLNEIKAQRLTAEAKARELVAQAEEDAARLAVDSSAKLAETIRRRQEQAERKIAQAEARAEADVKAAAADLATRLAEEILLDRAAKGGADPQIDVAIAQVGTRFN